MLDLSMNSGKGERERVLGRESMGLLLSQDRKESPKNEGLLGTGSGGPGGNGNGRPAKSLFSIRDLVECDKEPRGETFHSSQL